MRQKHLQRVALAWMTDCQDPDVSEGFSMIGTDASDICSPRYICCQQRYISSFSINLLSIKPSSWSQKQVWYQGSKSYVVGIAILCLVIPPCSIFCPLYVSISCQQGNALYVTPLHILSPFHSWWKTCQGFKWQSLLLFSMVGRDTMFKQYCSHWYYNILLPQWR